MALHSDGRPLRKRLIRGEVLVGVPKPGRAGRELNELSVIGGCRTLLVEV